MTSIRPFSKNKTKTAVEKSIGRNKAKVKKHSQIKLDLHPHRLGKEVSHGSDFTIRKGKTPVSVGELSYYNKYQSVHNPNIHIEGVGAASKELRGKTFETQHEKIGGKVYKTGELRTLLGKFKRSFPSAEHMQGARLTGAHTNPGSYSNQAIKLGKRFLKSRALGPVGAMVGAFTERNLSRAQRRKSAEQSMGIGTFTRNRKKK